MSDILFLAHRIPYPPDKGDKIRSWHMLKHLAERATVHLGAFVDDPADMAHAAKLRSICGEVKLMPLKPSDRWKRALRGLMGGDALSLALYYDPAMVKWVKQVLRQNRITTIVAFSSQMAPYALPHLGGRKGIMDFVDVDSEKWRQYAVEARPGLRQVMYKREAKLLRALEKYATHHFQASLFVSEAEAAVFRKLAGSYAHTVKAMNNGVDYRYFDPAAGFAPLPAATGPVIVFSGAMDYRPNIDAVSWFAEKIWPEVRKKHAGATFKIVGSKPAPEVKRLDGKNGVVVTGRVEDMRPHLAAADVCVAPLRIARGIQNKVLEAMAMARPVVATAAAFEGIEAAPGEHLLLADEPGAFADRIDELLRDTARAQAMGAAARAQVIARYDWDASLAMLDDIIGLKAPQPALVSAQ
ncbi:TIGR03087 family PEP-CTERM/XrtA system glycosyltransferase [Sphingoaurantiacus capsulatus]|uniref:TIGR03087 family PEP-CTERM/XrtA system glycosyltransferase n=1 Tax=Sphingoaurantiacus capsulatus TaxID=1771310 RepID=A0ABV7XEE8_9SPHN